MHQGGGDYATSSYYQYDHQSSPFQNPNPNSNPYDLYANSSPPITHASAPPISPGYSSSISNPPPFSHTYPPYSQNPDHVPVPVPNLPSNPNSVSFDAANFSYQQPAYYPPYDQNQMLLNYDPPSNSVHGSDFNSLVSSNSYSSAYNQPAGGGLAMPNYESGAGRYESQYDNRVGFGDDVAGAGVYAYKGGVAEPYGARGTASSGSNTSLAFDDYGRPISRSNGNGTGNDQGRSSGQSSDVVKAIPKSEMQHDVKSGVQKFRVTLLAEIGGPNMDVLCQIGLDGIRMLEPSTSRTLKIYPLETVTRCEVLDSSIFAFWSKSPVDIEPRRIRLKSNSYATNTILDAVTAATVQLKEMDEVKKTSEATNVSNQLAEKKKGLTDWVNLMKPRNEEKDHWVPDEAVIKCNGCATDFGAFVRRHHCRNCGDIFCDKCTQGRIVLTADEQAQPVRVCDQCMAEVTQRLSNARETSGQAARLHSHEDLAKKLQEEMDRKRQTSSGSKSNGSRMQMREVACPTCTVHLEVEVPTSGSKTIECSVCQHPFLVNAQ